MKFASQGQDGVAQTAKNLPEALIFGDARRSDLPGALMKKVAGAFHSLVPEGITVGFRQHRSSARLSCWMIFEGQRQTVWIDVQRVVDIRMRTDIFKVTGIDPSYLGPMNFPEFFKAAEHYYRSSVGGGGSGVQDGTPALYREDAATDSGDRRCFVFSQLDHRFSFEVNSPG